MITGIEVPLELAAMLCVGCMVAGAWMGQVRAQHHRLSLAHMPRPALFHPDHLAAAADLAAHRDARRLASHALLHGRIDQIGALRAAYTEKVEAEVREQIAGVMRAGLRRGDSMTITEGDRFTITVAGADERAALRIADRLRRKIAQLRLPQIGLEMRLTASFGVAADRSAPDNHALARRARQALEAAMARGQDHVVPASEIEEIRLLPAPAPTSSPPVAAA